MRFTANNTERLDADSQAVVDALNAAGSSALGQKTPEEVRAWMKENFRPYALDPKPPVAAIEHQQVEPQPMRTIDVNGQPRNYMELMGWVSLATLSLYPATAAPVGRTDAGLPVGVQIMGPYLEDRTSIDFAARLGELLGGFEPPLAATATSRNYSEIK